MLTFRIKINVCIFHVYLYPKVGLNCYAKDTGLDRTVLSLELDEFLTKSPATCINVWYSGPCYYRIYQVGYSLSNHGHACPPNDGIIQWNMIGDTLKKIMTFSMAFYRPHSPRPILLISVLLFLFHWGLVSHGNRSAISSNTTIICRMHWCLVVQSILQLPLIDHFVNSYPPTPLPRMFDFFFYLSGYMNLNASSLATTGLSPLVGSLDFSSQISLSLNVRVSISGELSQFIEKA